ncbi:hypothetical protein EHQ58_03570 [Leptospira ognonensis]|uniref:Uncharacterized protein n=1 Tax=Leptospira ognonensis TaxID=2484945 RepID=A0A4V3JRY9_9LEPT|nr:hypothetical protein [Leptospira ognonensis]TGL62291.1 hypothetical protein EHQ58_03570 [Leptospira ognonensis]
MNKITKFTLVMLVLTFATNCGQSGKIDESKANESLFVGLLAGNSAGQTSVLSSLAEIRGVWKDGFCSGGTCTGFTTTLSIAQDPTGFGIWTTGSGYFRIIESSNTSRYLIYQYLPTATFGNASKYTKILWTEPQTTECENSATKCFYYCTVLNSSFTGFSTIDEARNVVLDSTKYNTSDPKRSGCGGFGWSKALFQSNNPTSWP